MNSLTKNLKSQLEPFLALIAYRANYHDYYLESRTIEQGRMGSAAPLTEATLNSLIKMLRQNEKTEVVNIGGVVPPNLLFFSQSSAGQRRMVWYQPAEAREMHFAQSLHITNGKAQVPPMVYIAQNDSLYVFALSSSKRPSEKSVLYEPPFHNCANSGAVCLGSAKTKLPKHMTYTAIMEYYETLFWKSEFTHNGQAAVAGNLNLIWKEQIAKPDQPFNLKKLKATPSKLESLLK
jgi:PRTRC genetic system protein B